MPGNAVRRWEAGANWLKAITRSCQVKLQQFTVACLTSFQDENKFFCVCDKIKQKTLVVSSETNWPYK